MFSLIATELWNNFKKNMLISIIIIIQISLTFIIVAYTFDAYHSLQARQAHMKETFGNNLYYKLANEITTFHESIKFFSKEENFPAMKEFEEKMSQVEGLTRLLANERTIEFRDTFRPKDGLNETLQDFFNNDYAYDPKKPSTIERAYKNIRCFYINDAFIKTFDIKVSEGRLINEEDYKLSNLNKDAFPIMLGNDFKQYFDLGDKINIVYHNDNFTAEVVGFIEADTVVLEGQLNYTKNLNKCVVAPMLEVPAVYDENVSKQISIYTFLSLNELPFTYMVNMIDINYSEAAYNEMVDILQEFGWNRFFRFWTDRFAGDSFLDNSKNIFYIISIFSVIMVVFSVISIVFSFFNRALSNLKRYAIHLTAGGLHRNIFLYVFAEISVFMLMACMIGYYFVYREMGHLVNSLSSANYAFSMLIKVIIALYIVIIALSTFVIYRKIKKENVAMLIRGNEVPRKAKVASYRIILIIIFMFISIFAVAISNYYAITMSISKYYNDFLSNDAVDMVVSTEPTSSYSEENKRLLNFKEITDSIDCIIFREINSTYLRGDRPKITGVYFNGNVEMPELISGRLFTADEINSSEPLAVVGKDVLENFCTKEGDGSYVYRYNDLIFKVIGVVGKKDSVSDVDRIAYINLNAYNNKYEANGKYIIDAPNKANIDKVFKQFSQQIENSEDFELFETKPHPIANPYNNTLTAQVIYMRCFYMLLLNSLIFTFYFVQKMKYSISVKKFIGFSKAALVGDVFIDYLKLAGIGFVLSLGIAFFAMNTILAGSNEAVLFKLNPIALFIAFAGVATVAAVLAFISVTAIYKKDTSVIIR